MAQQTRADRIESTHSRLATSAPKSSKKHFFPKSRIGLFSIAVIAGIISLALLPQRLVAQGSQESNSRIDHLRGGNLGLRMKWSGEFFSGLGVRADAMGGSISTLQPGADAIAANPAGLGFGHGFQITLDWAPPLTINPGIPLRFFGVTNLEDKINDSLVQTAEDHSQGRLVTSEIVDKASLNNELDMRGGLKGGALMYANPVFAVAASFNRPFRVETQLSLSGTEFNAVALDNSDEVTHRIFGTLNGNLNLNLVVENSSVGFGTQIMRDRMSVGLALDAFTGEMNFEGTLLPHGIISTRNSEAIFNDPRRTQYDSLFTGVKGDWEGNAKRIRGGFAYHPSSNISLDATVVLPMTLDLHGPFSMIYNNVRALNFGAEGDEEVFDVDILVEDNLTKTQRRNIAVPNFALEVPGQAAMGFSAKWDIYLASVVYTKFLNRLGYKFSYVETDSLGANLGSGQIHHGANLAGSLRFGIGVETLMVGLGALFGETFREEFSDGNPEPAKNVKSSLFIPYFSLGGGIRVGPRFRLDYAVSPYNSSFLRISTSYKL